jgi:hypothetical protein
MFSFAPIALAVRSRVSQLLTSNCDAAPFEWDYNWDMKRNAAQPKGIRQIVLVRHGQYLLGENEDEKQVLTELGMLHPVNNGAVVSQLPVDVRHKQDAGRQSALVNG